ncbi:MAG: 3-deoxy-7-phosphoheptulonate synthase [Lachnospiraceae bacterium]|nr:3-deoxy-7-phosphoheptulonate synthase [Lachnospiraceae bacterium]
MQERKQTNMNFEYVEELPSPEEIKKEIPMAPELEEIKKKRDKEIADILKGKEDKFLLIIGPCSADNEAAVLDYTCRLKKVADKVEDKILVIPRVYTNKPRTTGKGYKGMLHQPDPEKKPNLLEGLKAIRSMHIHVVEETGLTPADEMLYPENHNFLDDVLSYVAVGARSTEDQLHRMTASGIDIPVGMKNPTSGDFSVMLNSIVAAQAPQMFIYRGWEVRTYGNPLAHAVLRGAVDKHGQTHPNYHYEDLIRLFNMYSEKKLENPAVIVDTNHSNSGKQFKEQIRISKEVLHSKRHSADVNHLVKGLMIESYIEEGCQKVGEGVYGKSITDPCLGWQDTERLIYEIAELL